MQNYYNRLPIYLLLDCSGGMHGERMQAVCQGLRSLLSDLRSKPIALNTVYLSVITFASIAQQMCPLTKLTDFQEPNLNVGGGVSLGAALRLLEQCIDREVQKATDTEKGDLKPLVFLFMYREPTDRWDDVAERLKQNNPANIIACAASPALDEFMLSYITPMVVKLATPRPDAIKTFFKWVTQPIEQVSQSIAQGLVDVPMNLPLPPHEILICQFSKSEQL